MLRRKEQGSKKCRGSAAQRRSLFFVPLALMRYPKDGADDYSRKVFHAIYLVCVRFEVICYPPIICSSGFNEYFLAGQ